MRISALAALLALAATADAGPKPGKIVRVERPRTGAGGAPRVCQLSPGDNSLSCFGLPPVVGETANVVSTDGIMAEVQITKVQEQDASGQRGSCNQNLWRAETALTEGASVPVNGLPYGSWVIFDVGMSATAELTEAPTELPADQAGESVAVALDRDGQPPADFLVTWYPCNHNSTSSSMQTYCIDYWFASGSQWNRLRQDLVTWCTY